MPVSSKNRCARYLSPIVRHTSGLGASTRAGARSSRAAETISWSRSVSGTTRRTSCSATSEASAGDVAGVVDARDERLHVGVVQGRRQRVEIGRDRRRAGSPEGAHDVDALARAREEDADHPTSERTGGRRGSTSLVPAVVHRLPLGGRRLRARLPHVDDVPATSRRSSIFRPVCEVRSRKLLSPPRPISRSRRARRSPRRGSRARRRAPSCDRIVAGRVDASSFSRRRHFSVSSSAVGP